MSNYLHSAARPVEMADDETYRLVTVKRSRGGVVKRETLKGREISVKSQFQIKEGDFLISKRQIVHGACGLVPAELDGAIVSNEYAILRGNNQICLEFLNYLAHSIYFQQTCFHSSIGVHVEKMIFKLDRWLKWDFNIPPLAEQKRIAEILWTWDRAIEATKKLIADGEAQKKALMQQLLTGKKRLPGFGKKWTRFSVADMGKVVSGGTPDSNNSECWDGEIAWATPTDITKLSTRYISSTDRCITAKGLSSSAARLLPAGTVIVCTRATIGELAIAAVAMTTNQGFKNIVLNDEHDSDFVYYLIQYNKKALSSVANGSTFSEVSKADFEKLSFLIPQIDEQQAISSILVAADGIVERKRLYLNALQTEKAALMQQLLTGKRRVKIKGEAQAA